MLKKTVLSIVTATIVVAQLACRLGAPSPTPTPAPTAQIELHKPAQLATVKVNGIEYGTEFDNRIAFTNGEILTGHTAPYSDGELAMIQKTWVEYTIEMPANAAFPVAFGYSIDSENGKIFSPGAVIMLPVDQNTIKVKILDGELVLWRSLKDMHRDISDRISKEIANGNLTIGRPLAFSWVSQEFASYIPQDLLTANKVEIVK